MNVEQLKMHDYLGISALTLLDRTNVSQNRAVVQIVVLPCAPWKDVHAKGGTEKKSESYMKLYASDRTPV